MSSSRLTVLCLHGFSSNGAVHTHQLRRLTAKLPDYDFIIPDGPYQVDIASQTDLSKPENQAWHDLVTSMGTSGHRAWWFARDRDPKTGEIGSFYGLEKSLDYINTLIQDKGPFHAIWGFSQGACFAGILCSLLQEKNASHPLRKHFSPAITAPKAGVIFAGFRARFPQYDNIYDVGVDLPVLHVIGEKDVLVNSERSETLIKVCRNSRRLTHVGGHDIPRLDEDQAKVVEFMRTNVPASNGQANSVSM